MLNLIRVVHCLATAGGQDVFVSNVCIRLAMKKFCNRGIHCCMGCQKQFIHMPVWITVWVAKGDRCLRRQQASQVVNMQETSTDVIREPPVCQSLVCKNTTLQCTRVNRSAVLWAGTKETRTCL